MLKRLQQICRQNKKLAEFPAVGGGVRAGPRPETIEHTDYSCISSAVFCSSSSCVQFARGFISVTGVTAGTDGEPEGRLAEQRQP